MRSFRGKKQVAKTQVVIASKKKMVRSGILSFFCVLFFSFKLAAAEKFEFYTGARALGMGGASIAVVNDETAVFSNPAALSKLRDPFFTMVDPEIHYGADTSSFLTGFDINVIGLDNLLGKLATVADKNFHLKLQLFPSIAVQNFTLGVLLKYEMNGSFDSVANEINLDYTNDTTAVLGYSLRFWDGRIKFGFSGRYINRSQITSKNPIDASNLNLEFGNVAQSGGAVALDAGFILAIPWKMLPTIAIVGRDLGNTRFSLGAGVASGSGVDPDTVDQSIDVAFALFPILANRSRTTFTVEVRDILSTDQDDKDDLMRRVHAGAEINFNDIFFIRGGMNQRYWTAGLEFAITNFQFQVATYGEEIGDAITKKEDRRYVAKFAYRY